MKKRLMLLGTLLVLGVAGMAVISGQAVRSAREITWTAETLYGDPAAAEGLSLATEHSYLNHLFWSSRINAVGQGTVDYRFRPREPEVEREERYFLDINDYCPGYIQFSTYTYLDEEQAQEYPMLGLVYDVGTRGPADGTYTETVRCKDYFEVITPEVGVHLPGGNRQLTSSLARNQSGVGEEAERLRITTELAEAFRFPTPEEYQLKVTVTNENGKVKAANIENVDDYYLQVRSTNGLLSGDWFYFTVDATCGPQSGELLDYSLTPGGNALYRLSAEDRPLSLNDLEVVLPLEDGEAVTAINADPDGSHVFVVTEREGTSFLRVLDHADGQVSLELEFPPQEQDWTGLWGSINCSKDLACFIVGREIVLMAEENGSYREIMRCTQPQEVEKWAHRQGGRVAAYDGRRLALAVELPYAGEGGSSNDIGILVFDRENCLYAGELQPGFDKQNTQIGAFGMDTVSLSWQ